MLAPALGLAWPQFFALWIALLMGALLVLVGPILFVVVLPFPFFELWGGNITLLLYLAIVVGLWYSAPYVFGLLPTPKHRSGLVWFLLLIHI